MKAELKSIKGQLLELCRKCFFPEFKTHIVVKVKIRLCSNGFPLVETSDYILVKNSPSVSSPQTETDTRILSENINTDFGAKLTD